ncbi:MAG TPA: hypothetical protein VOA80_18305 [Thermoanaerobaculia bacterium]|nr:hypothetical protein [Thermoanaerobaculia bacterium]
MSAAVRRSRAGAAGEMRAGATSWRRAPKRPPAPAAVAAATLALAVVAGGALPMAARAHQASPPFAASTAQGGGASGAGAAGAGTSGAGPYGAVPSNRSIEVLRLDCASRLGRREVTLFGNGTIRLRDGPIGKEWMGLAELGPDELQGTLRRLGEEDLSDASHLPQGVVGEWVEKCDLALALPGGKRQKFFYGRYDTLPLALYRVQRVAEELADKVALLRDVEVLPEHYEPRLGDVLKRTDGMRYRVVNFTSDRKGIELDGLDQPLHLIVLKEQMRMEFVGIVSRER